MRRLLLPAMALMLSGLLSGCGLHPLYEGGLHSAGAKGLAGVEVAPIPGKAGWLVRNALNERLAPMSGGTPRYKLTVSLDDKIDGLGVRSDNTVTRERRTLRARFQLHDNNQPADAPALVDEVVGSDAGLDVTSSEYATVAAEDTALERLSEVIADRIVARIAIDAEHRAGK